ncbi:MAG: Ig-like domain repeat protein [Thaumarchaeota archaeon]|nr:Ig-like domain repeat protein [Nitrososphaerota archaeon]
MQRLTILAVTVTLITLIGFLNHNAYSLDSTNITVTPNPSTVNSGAQVTFTATVADTTNSTNIPTGTVTWSDGGSGGTFTPTPCTLSSGSCTTSYTASTTSLPGVAITANYAGDSTHSTNSSSSSLTVNLIHSTITTVTPNPATLSTGSVTFVVKVNDTYSSPTTPTSTVTWSAGGSGGTFNPASCTLSSGTCTTSYTASTNSASSVAITANYAGDSTHSSSSGTSSLTVNQIHSTTTTVTPNPSTVNSGAQVTFTVTIIDSHMSPTTPTGTVTWSDGGSGGTFTPTPCTLSSGSCTTSYTASITSTSSVTITASYAGDSAHSGSAGISSLSVNVLHRTTVSLTPNPVILSSNGTVTYVVKINDASSSPTTPSGTVSWKDNNAGGQFNATSCTLSSGACVSRYVASGNPPNVITINATYSGDSTHLNSFATSQISTNVISGTTTTVTPNPATFTSGNAVTFTATVADTSNPSTSLIGIISWSDNGAGGTFTPNNCILSGNHCSLSYTPHSDSSTMITISATYLGDSYHSSSFGVSSLSATSSTPSTPTTPSTTPPQPTLPSPQPSAGVIVSATQQDIDNIDKAKNNETIAAEINIMNQTVQTTSIDNNISVHTNNTSPDSLSVTVSAPSQTIPKVLLINLEDAAINAGNLKYLGIMYDGNQIAPAVDVNSILHAKSTDNPSFAIITTQSGAQILVLIPHFSTHVITITNMSKVIPPIPEFPFAMLVLVISTASLLVFYRIKFKI